MYRWSLLWKKNCHYDAVMLLLCCYDKFFSYVDILLEKTSKIPTIKDRQEMV